jgi:hypothetical protein
MSRKSILTLAAIAALGTSILAPVDAFAHGSFGRTAGGHSSMGMSHVGPAPSMGHVGRMTSASVGEGYRRNGEVFRPEHRTPFWHHPFWHRDYDHPFWHRDYGRWFGHGGGVYGGIETVQGGGYSVGGSYQPSSGGTAAAPAAPCNCLTKQYLPDGSVLFQDICTREAATMPAAQQANGPAPR